MSIDASTTATDREARFRVLYASLYDDVLRFVARRVHPSHADDVVAEVFLVVWRRLPDVPSSLDSSRAWVFGVARNTLQSSRRSSGRREALAVRIANAEPRPDNGNETELVAHRLDLVRAWPTISATDQEAIALVAWDGLTAPEAAAVLGISAVAFRLRLSRARRRLRQHLGEPARGSRATSTTDPYAEGPRR